VHPYVFGIEVYRPILALCVIVVSGLLLALVRRDGFPLLPVVKYVALLTIATFVGAKAMSVVFHAGTRDVATELSGGLRFPGALLGVGLAAWFFRGMLPAGLSLARFADLWAPCFSLACAVGRMGCLLMGCCYGVVANLPWSIRYPRGSTPWWEHFHAGRIESVAQASLPVHPFPVYLMALELGLFALTLWLLPRRSYDGQVVLVFLALHGAAKSALEFARDPYNPLHQVVFLVAVAATIALLRFRRLNAVQAPRALAAGA
jgi:phosphatidylglycerol---prolipoprotein diacylglyceryl transferase